MENELEAISQAADVSYLLTRLRLAKRKNEEDIANHIKQRLKDIGVFDEKAVGQPFQNLRATVDHILKNDRH